MLGFLQSFFNKKSVRNVLLALMILLAAVSLIQGVRNAVRDSQDFQWDAMKVFSHGINPYDESDSMNPSGILDKYGYDEYYLQMEANQFPSLLMILLPFSVFKPLTARYVWIVCNLIFTALIIFLLRKTFLKEIDTYWFGILSLVMIAGTPYRNQLGVGQHTLFAFCFFLIAVYYSEYREKRNVLITVIALFICYFKYTLTVPLVLYFIYKKRYREIVASVIPHIVLTFVGAWWLNDSFINMIIKPLKVSSNLAAEGGLDISALMKGSPLAYAVALIIMLLLFYMALKLQSGYDAEYFSLLTLWSLIITYHRTYDFFVMIAVAGMFASGALINKSRARYDVADNKSEEHAKVQASDSKNDEKNGTGSDWFSIGSLNLYYILTMLAVFFVLRVFSESTPSKIAVGFMYYVLTGAVTYIMIKKLKAV